MLSGIDNRKMTFVFKMTALICSQLQKTDRTEKTENWSLNLIETHFSYDSKAAFSAAYAP